MLFAFGYVVFVCVQDKICKYGVGLVGVLGCLYIDESLFYFFGKILPVGFAVVRVAVAGLEQAEFGFGAE